MSNIEADPNPFPKIEGLRPRDYVIGAILSVGRAVVWLTNHINHETPSEHFKTAPEAPTPPTERMATVDRNFDGDGRPVHPDLN